MIVASVQARRSPSVSDTAAAIRTAMIRIVIAQNSVVSGAHLLSSCAPTRRSPGCSTRGPGSVAVAMTFSSLGRCDAVAADPFDVSLRSDLRCTDGSRLVPQRLVDLRLIEPAPPQHLLCGRGLDVLHHLPQQEERRRPEADEDGKPLGTGLVLPTVGARGAPPERDCGPHGREAETVEHVAVYAQATKGECDSHRL